MTDRTERHGLSVDAGLADFIDDRALAGTGLDADSFWQGFAALLERFRERNAELLEKREALQGQVDDWHRARAGREINASDYMTFLYDIGYLVPEPGEFVIGTNNVDPEIATMAGPQLVVPALNDRFVLNAANARWGSLYDALYGTDALDAPPAKPGGYDAARGAAVIARAKAYLDEILPLKSGKWADVTDIDAVELAGPGALVGRSDKSRLFRHNGLHIDVLIDADHYIGKDDPSVTVDMSVIDALGPAPRMPDIMLPIRP